MLIVSVNVVIECSTLVFRAKASNKKSLAKKKKNVPKEGWSEDLVTPLSEQVCKHSHPTWPEAGHCFHWERLRPHSLHKLLAVLKSVLCAQGQTMSMLQIPLMASPPTVPIPPPPHTHTTVSSWLIKTLGVAATAVTQLFARDIPLISQRHLVPGTMLCSPQRFPRTDQLYVRTSLHERQESNSVWAKLGRWDTAALYSE